MSLAQDLMGLGTSPLLAAHTSSAGTGPVQVTIAGGAYSTAPKIGAFQFLISVNVSGTKMRAMLAAGNTRKFAEFLPPAVQGNAAEIISILQRKSTNEALLRKFVRCAIF
jgi:hypothetical protein